MLKTVNIVSANMMVRLAGCVVGNRMECSNDNEKGIGYGTTESATDRVKRMRVSIAPPRRPDEFVSPQRTSASSTIDKFAVQGSLNLNPSNSQVRLQQMSFKHVYPACHMSCRGSVRMVNFKLPRRQTAKAVTRGLESVTMAW